MSSNNDRFDKIDGKLDKLDARLDSMTVTLVENTESLKYHIKRTDLLEEQLVKELTPIKNHVNMMTTGFKVITFLAVTTVGILSTIKILKEMGIF